MCSTTHAALLYHDHTKVFLRSFFNSRKKSTYRKDIFNENKNPKISHIQKRSTTPTNW
jgi:hypothetical protein